MRRESSGVFEGRHRSARILRQHPPPRTVGDVVRREGTANWASMIRGSRSHQSLPGKGADWGWSSLPITGRTRSGLWQKMVRVTAPVLSYASCCFASYYSPPKNLGARPNWTAISVLHPGGRHGLRPADDVGCTQQCAPLKRSPTGPSDGSGQFRRDPCCRRSFPSGGRYWSSGGSVFATRRFLPDVYDPMTTFLWIPARLKT